MKDKAPELSGLLKVGQLAKAAGVSVSTVKFYVKEGLVRPVCKTGKNMAYYDPAAVQTIGLVRKLQKQRYYPLSVIKSLLDGGPAPQEMALLDAIYKADGEGAEAAVPAAQVLADSGLTADQAARLQKAGLVSPEGPARYQRYSREDAAVMALVGRRVAAGIPFSQSVRSLEIYQKALDEAAQADVDAFVSQVFMARDFTAEEGADLIRVSDETLDQFIAIRRKERNRFYGAARMQDLERFAQRLGMAAQWIAQTLQAAGRTEGARLCLAVGLGRRTGIPAADQVESQYWAFCQDTGDTPRRIARALRARGYFQALVPAGDGPEALAQWLLKWAWLALAPEILGCRPAAQKAWQALSAWAREACPELPLQALASKLEEWRVES